MLNKVLAMLMTLQQFFVDFGGWIDRRLTQVLELDGIVRVHR